MALGGALGAASRYLVGRAVHPVAASPAGGAAFPRGTLIVNVTGCLLFGLLAGWLSDRAPESVRLFVFAGILGGYTTFSSFGGETMILAKDQPLRAALYVALSVGLGLAGVASGAWLGARLR